VNLVVGATGMLGGEICRLLAEQGRPVRALVRADSDPAKVDALRELGADLRVGDLKDPETLEPACVGADAVISTASSTTSRREGDTIESVDRDGQLALVDAASKAGVGRFVYVSFPEFDVEFPLQTAKRTVERRIRETGMDSTILQPTNYMEVWLSPLVGFDPAAATARIYGAGEAKVSWVSFRDVARATVGAAHDPSLANVTVAFGGPEALSPLEVVRIFEEETGRTFSLEHVPEEAIEAQLESSTDSLERSFAALMLVMARARAVPPANLPDLRSVRDHAARAVAAEPATSG
jgi:uncharacterized protein YbjT (DUF2867 family)